MSVFLLVIALWINTVESDYVDGRLRIGDEYGESIWSTDTYEIFQLPNGVHTNAIAFYNGSGFLSMRYVVCPRDYTCTNRLDSKQILVRMDMESLKISQIYHLNNLTERFSSEHLLPFDVDLREYVYLLSESGGIFRVHIQSGHYQRYDSQDKVSRGAVDLKRDIIYLLLYNGTIVQIPLGSFSPRDAKPVLPCNGIKISPRVHIFAHNRNTGTLYVVEASDERVNHTTIYQTWPWVGFQQDEDSNRQIIPRKSSLMKALFTHRDHYLLALFVDDSERGKHWSDDRSMTLYRLLAENLTIVDQIQFSSREFAGHLSTNESSFIYTHGAELIQFDMAGKMNSSEMTLLKQHYAPKTDYDADSMPNLAAAKIYNGDVAFIAAENGVLLRVNLTKFCPDGREGCDRVPVWVMPLSLMIGVPCVITTALLCVIHRVFQMRKRERSVRPYYDIIAERDYGQPIVETPLMTSPRLQRTYDAINDRQED